MFLFSVHAFCLLEEEEEKGRKQKKGWSNKKPDV